MPAVRRQGTYRARLGGCDAWHLFCATKCEAVVVHGAVFAQHAGHQDPGQAGPASGASYRCGLVTAMQSVEGLPTSEGELPRDARWCVRREQNARIVALSWADLARAVGRSAVAGLVE